MKKELHPISETELKKAFPVGYPIIQILKLPVDLFNYCCKKATPDRFQDPRDLKEDIIAKLSKEIQ